MSIEKDPYMDEAILHFAQAETTDFVTGLEIGQDQFKKFADSGFVNFIGRIDLLEQAARDSAIDRIMVTRGSLQALMMGARAAIDEIVNRQEVTT